MIKAGMFRARIIPRMSEGTSCLEIRFISENTSKKGLVRVPEASWDHPPTFVSALRTLADWIEQEFK